MNALNPADLAPCLPIGENIEVFQYYVTLDSTFLEPSLSGVAPIDMSKLPQQFAIPANKKDENWYVGFNVFMSGAIVQFQPFFWAGGTPPALGQLTSNSNAWQFAATPTPVSLSAPSQNTVTVTAYPWLTTNVMPLSLDFSIQALNGEVVPVNPIPTPVIVETLQYQNNGQVPVTYTPTIIYDYTQTVLATVTDTNTYQAGISTTWSGKVNLLVAGSTFSVTLSFNYTYAHSTTATQSTAARYVVQQVEQFTLNPGDSQYVSIILDVDNNASAILTIQMALSGTLNGTPLSSSFLQQLATAMGATNITTPTATQINYTLSGTVTGTVVASSTVSTSSTPPNNGPKPKATDMKTVPVLQANLANA